MERRFSLMTVLLTFGLLIAGGLVHSTDSGLACPDWPLCYGEVFPTMEGGVLFEHTHRLIAALVAVLTFLTALLIWKNRKQASFRSVGFYAFGLVLFQAFLGGLTVLFKLPTLVSTAHLGTSMIFFSMMVFLAIRLNTPEVTLKPSTKTASLVHLKKWTVIAFGLIYAQILLGALVRHTGAGSVCSTFPLCHGSFWPTEASPTVYLHLLHRYFALILGGFLLFYFFYGLKELQKIAQKDRRAQVLRLQIFAMPLLLILQIVLGVASVLTYLAILPVTSHLAGGALLLANAVGIWTLLDILLPSQPKNPNFTFVADLFSLAKGRLNLLVLIVATIAYFLSPLAFENSSSQFLSMLVGVFLLVSGASFLNAYFERDMDALMQRTTDRPLPKGRISHKGVLWGGIAMALIGVPLLTLGVNPLTGLLGVLAFLLYSFVYTPLKAKTSFAALIGAIPGALPPLIGWTAATGRIDLVGMTLFFILFFWQLPHFFAIAIYRKEEYSKAGIQVMPLANGENLTRRLMLRYSAMLIPVSLFLVPLGIGGMVYFTVALLLGLTFFFWTCYGQKPTTGIAWARSLFIYSLIYLPLLFVTLLMDTRL